MSRCAPVHRPCERSVCRASARRGGAFGRKMGVRQLPVTEAVRVGGVMRLAFDGEEVRISQPLDLDPRGGALSALAIDRDSSPGSGETRAGVTHAAAAGLMADSVKAPLATALAIHAAAEIRRDDRMRVDSGMGASRSPQKAAMRTPQDLCSWVDPAAGPLLPRYNETINLT
jgi:hypothetical protein